MRALLLAGMLSGCASLNDPPNECRVSIIKGAGRYGTFTQYIKGDGDMVRIVQAGKGCGAVKVTIEQATVEVN